MPFPLVYFNNINLLILVFVTVENMSIISELQALRDVLFMLLGYPCVLFQLGGKDSPNDEVTVWVDTTATNSFALRHSSLAAFQAILSWYAEKGTNLNRIRAFTKTTHTQDPPDRETFIAATATQLAILDQKLIAIEERLVGNKSSDQIVSLLSLQRELEPILHPYMLLSTILHTLTSPTIPLPAATLATAHLELLFTSACTLQSIGDTHSFTFMSTLFFTCLQTYLRPIRAWMERGELRKGDEIFLVTKTRADDEVELGGLWHDQFALRRDDKGVLMAPRFVHKAAGRIFITGKSVVFLNRLMEQRAVFETEGEGVRGGELTAGSVYGLDEGEEFLAPFQDVFAAAFDRWIDGRHHSVSSRLRDILYRDCGLWKSLDALECIYLCRDGYLFDSLATAVFEKVDKGVQTWGDRFLLTELVQGVYGGVECVEAQRLRMRGRIDGVATLRERRRSVKMLKGVDVDYAVRRLPSG